jgi:UDP-N-acetylglucosamine 2-epimerase (non-hydrolysing)
LLEIEECSEPDLTGKRAMIHFIIGTRAQLIKTAPLMAECIKRNIPYNFIFLAQHKRTMYEMMEIFEIRRPDKVLGDLGKDVSNMGLMLRWVIKVCFEGFVRLREMFDGDRKGIVVVHGDALPALIGAILARAAGLRVAHVEAGLRSFNFAHPFPEELIRVLVWKLRLVDYYFSPNEWAMQNLTGYPGTKFNTRCNTLLDSVRLALCKSCEIGRNLKIPSLPYGIVSLHRFETLSRKESLEKVVTLLGKIAKEMKLLFILHPPTIEALKKYGIYDLIAVDPHIELRRRYDYFSFIALLINSQFLISDGGSNQEECFYLGHPCLLLRYETERTEGMNSNVVLSRFDEKAINNFVTNYHLWRCENHFDTKPSEMIISELARLASLDC